MNGMARVIFLAVSTLLVVSTSAGATDQLVPGTRLSLKVRNGRERLSFKSRGTFTIPVAGSADDPTRNGISHPASSQHNAAWAGCISCPVAARLPA